MGDRGDDRSQRVLTGIGLALVGLFTLLSLVPVQRLGPSIKGLFPSGNIVGPVGAAVAGSLTEAVGAAAVVAPLLALLWALWSLGALPSRHAGRGSIFLGLVLLTVPPLAASLAFPAGGEAPGLSGAYGSWAGALMGGVLSWLGSALVLAALMIAGFIATLGLGPFRALKRVAAWAWSALLKLAIPLASGTRVTAGWMQRRWAELAQRLGRPRRVEMSLWAAAEVEPEDFDAGQGADAAAAAVAGPVGIAGNGERRERRAQLELPDPGDPTASDLPPLDLLTPPIDADYSISEEALDELGEVLMDKLRTFRVEGRIAGRTTGPVVTQFEVVPASGVKVGKIAALADDLALALKAPSVRIIAPIPGKGAVGVEVPNPERKVVHLREILESSAFRRSRTQLPLALGKDVTGRPYVSDLARMPHLLIAGVTGSGKSVCINGIISTLVYRYTPEQLRVILIDPKMVELAGYNVLPHLRHPVVTDNSDAACALRWLVYEMELRYEWLSANGCRNLAEYNRLVAQGKQVRAPEAEGGARIDEPEVKPYIVLVIDELADLMMTVQGEVERPLAFLAQKARATGIHLIVATQRPSVNVITGLIKANFSCRIAFRVASKVDSRTIIDQNGAETLLGNGDMLFLPPGEAEPARIQGAYVSSEDTDRLIDWYSKQAAARRMKLQEEEDILEVTRQREREEAELGGATQETFEDRDPIFRQAAEVVIQHQQGSTSLLQRRLKIGYGRAARIVDQLHEAGIVGPPEGSKPREVLATLEDLDRMKSTRAN